MARLDEAAAARRRPEPKVRATDQNAHFRRSKKHFAPQDAPVSNRRSARPHTTAASRRKFPPHLSTGAENCPLSAATKTKLTHSPKTPKPRAKSETTIPRSFTHEMGNRDGHLAYAIPRAGRIWRIGKRRYAITNTAAAPLRDFRRDIFSRTKNRRYATVTRTAFSRDIRKARSPRVSRERNADYLSLNRRHRRLRSTAGHLRAPTHNRRFAAEVAATSLRAD